MRIQNNGNQGNKNSSQAKNLKQDKEVKQSIKNLDKNNSLKKRSYNHEPRQGFNLRKSCSNSQEACNSKEFKHLNFSNLSSGYLSKYNNNLQSFEKGDFSINYMV